MVTAEVVRNGQILDMFQGLNKQTLLMDWTQVVKQSSLGQIQGSELESSGHLELTCTKMKKAPG